MLCPRSMKVKPDDTARAEGTQVDNDRFSFSKSSEQLQSSLEGIGFVEIRGWLPGTISL